MISVLAGHARDASTLLFVNGITAWSAFQQQIVALVVNFLFAPCPTKFIAVTVDRPYRFVCGLDRTIIRGHINATGILDKDWKPSIRPTPSAIIGAGAAQAISQFPEPVVVLLPFFLNSLFIDRQFPQRRKRPHSCGYDILVCRYKALGIVISFQIRDRWNKLHRLEASALLGGSC